MAVDDVERHTVEPAGARPGDRSYAALCARIIETNRHLFIVLDDEVRIVFANPVVEDQLGYRPDELVGRSALDFVHPDDVGVAAEALDQIVAESAGRLGAGVAMALRLRAADGSYRHFEVGAEPHLDDPEVRGTILHCRVNDGPALLDLALRGLAEGRPLEEVLDVIAAGAAANVEPSRAVIAWDWDGAAFRHAVPADLPAAVRGLVAADGPVPWTAAMDRREVVDVDVDDLPPAIAGPAATAGLAACWAVPVHRSRPTHNAVLLIWRTVAGGTNLTHRVALERVATTIDIAFQRHHDDLALLHAARHDTLTGVANRARFFEELERLAAADGAAASDHLHGVLYLDLDDFKPVNDVYGHAAGDEVLRVVTRRLRSHLREEDLVARLGGDEFAVLCPAVPSIEQVGAVADRLVAAIAEPIGLGEDENGVTVRVAASIGVAAVPGDVLPRMGGDALLEQADRALRTAKAAGKHRWLPASIG